MILEKFKPCKQDTWEWRLAKLSDIDAIVTLADSQFTVEVSQFIKTDPHCYAHNLAHAVINQNNNPLSEQLIVAVAGNKLYAYAWMQRNQFMPFSVEELAEARFVHLDLQLPARTRIHLLAQILQQWEIWCQLCQVKIICSSTIRGQQDVFLRLHEQAGYSVRGSVCFKRLDNV